eukprot:scaffold91982_cov30-Tisochrysis_lutea.AAC.4
MAMLSFVCLYFVFSAFPPWTESGCIAKVIGKCVSTNVSGKEWQFALRRALFRSVTPRPSLAGACHGRQKIRASCANLKSLRERWSASQRCTMHWIVICVLVPLSPIVNRQ